MRLRVAVLILLACSAAVAQKGPAKKHTPAAKPTDARKTWPIETITIKGNEVYSREQILTLAGIQPGDQVTRDGIEAARDRLAASGAFDHMEFRFGPAPGSRGYAIEFTVSEAGPFYPVRFEDMNISEADARAALKRADPLFGDRIPPTRARIEKCAEALSAAAGATIVGSLTPDDSGQLAIIFRPEGSQPIIARVVFKGAESIHSSMLENAVSPVAVGRAFRDSRFRAILDATVRPIYEAHGRAGVEFTRIETAPEEGVDGVVVTVTVKEGELYSLGKLTITGAGNPVSLARVAALKSGDMFNIEEVRAAASRIEKALRHDGHMRVATDTVKSVDHAAKRVDVTIRVTPGPQYRFGKLNIDGLDITTEPVVRKLWGVKAGEPFDADYPAYFLDRVREEQYFDDLGKISSKIDLNDASHTADVTLIFGPAEPPKKPAAR